MVWVSRESFITIACARIRKPKQVTSVRGSKIDQVCDTHCHNEILSLSFKRRDYSLRFCYKFMPQEVGNALSDKFLLQRMAVQRLKGKRAKRTRRKRKRKNLMKGKKRILVLTKSLQTTQTPPTPITTTTTTVIMNISNIQRWKEERELRKEVPRVLQFRGSWTY